jgi:hypothetical protein
MTKTEEATRSMYFKVEEFIDGSDLAVLALMPSFNSEYANFKTTLTEIREVSENQLYNRTGMRIEKELRENDMVDKAIVVSNKIRAYALDIADWYLFKSFNKTKSGIIRLRDTITLDYCQRVHDKANELLAALAPYEVTAAELTDLLAAIEEYKLWIPKPRTAIEKRRYLTEKLTELFAKAKKIVFVMDTQVGILLGSHPEWVKKYKLSRITVDIGSRALSLRGFVFDLSGNPIQKAVVEIEGLNLSKQTTAKGQFEFKSLPSGFQNVIIKRDGFDTYKTTVVIVQNQRTDIKVELKPVMHVAQVS